LTTEELDKIYDSLNNIDIISDIDAIRLFITIVIITELPITKGDSKLKDVIINVIKDPKHMLILVSVWNLLNPGKMIPNSIRRALKYILENKFTHTQLLNVVPFNKIYLKDIIKISRPRPFSVTLSKNESIECYNNNITLISPNGITLNKQILGLSFNQLNLQYESYSHKDIFKIIIDNNI
jgi:hypothetical protein